MKNYSWLGVVFSCERSSSTSYNVWCQSVSSSLQHLLNVNFSNCQATGTGNGDGYPQSQEFPPQLLTMKECTDKKVLQVKMSSDDLYPSSKNNCPGGQRPQQPGESNKITKKVDRCLVLFKACSCQSVTASLVYFSVFAKSNIVPISIYIFKSYIKCQKIVSFYASRR